MATTGSDRRYYFLYRGTNGTQRHFFNLGMTSAILIRYWMGVANFLVILHH